MKVITKIERITEEHLKTSLDAALKLAWTDADKEGDSIDNIIESIIKLVRTPEYSENGLKQDIFLHMLKFARRDNLHYFHRFHKLEEELFDFGEKYKDKFSKEFPEVLYISEKGIPIGVNIKIRKFLDKLVYSLKKT